MTQQLSSVAPRVLWEGQAFGRGPTWTPDKVSTNPHRQRWSKVRVENDRIGWKARRVLGRSPSRSRRRGLVSLPGLAHKCPSTPRRPRPSSASQPGEDFKMPADFRLPEIVSPAAMEKYVSAIQKMEQTVMFPSLLRGVSLEDLEDAFGADSADKDLFEHFMLLKSSKGMLEGGGPLPLRQEKLPVVPQVEEKMEKDSLEDIFYYHLSSLYRVLHHLTRRAQAVTGKYNEIMERINRS